MPRYHFNVRDGESFPDPDGKDLPNLEAAQREALACAGRLLSENAAKFWDGEDWSLEVTDHIGLVLFALHFMVILAPVLGSR